METNWEKKKKFDREIPNTLKAVNFQQESRILDKIGPVKAAHAEEEETGRACLQVPEKGIHKFVEKDQDPYQDRSLQLSLFL